MCQGSQPVRRGTSSAPTRSGAGTARPPRPRDASAAAPSRSSRHALRDERRAGDDHERQHGAHREQARQLILEGLAMDRPGRRPGSARRCPSVPVRETRAAITAPASVRPPTATPSTRCAYSRSRQSRPVAAAVGGDRRRGSRDQHGELRARERGQQREPDRRPAPARAGPRDRGDGRRERRGASGSAAFSVSSPAAVSIQLPRQHEHRRDERQPVADVAPREQPDGERRQRRRARRRSSAPPRTRRCPRSASTPARSGTRRAASAGRPEPADREPVARRDGLRELAVDALVREQQRDRHCRASSA